ncbi:hypothetical protein MOBT1_003065 [Malassezia obtusa]|uniref:Trafficking protein particle complex subunit 6B n=1 Tax=Malassezia obtusa TaxID=76774 RepID=A0AAF0E143_9BASI|nr:hypothetical protein MOBT1_003065 [Malassezia obtusa]
MHAAVPSTVLGAPAPTAPLVSDGVRAASAPVAHTIDRTCVDVLQIEMAATLAASAAYKTRRANDMVAQLQLDDPDARVPPALSSADEAEMALSRMEAVGTHVGACLVERLAQDRPRTQQTLERVKFVCKELWYTVWDKQIDNLRTNHRVRRVLTQGVFVLQDAAFRPLLHARDAPAYVDQQLAFATGVVQGALRRLGVAATVQADASALPQCTSPPDAGAFHVRVA